MAIRSSKKTEEKSYWCVFKNTIKGSNIGMISSVESIIWCNNFIANRINVLSSKCLRMDNGSVGNYWDDYRYKHPFAKKKDGIWNKPYRVLFGVDRYPLVNPL